ncbi:MAG TPA: hypothetical protein VMI75_38605 [Polyangiaceae bacterium]|nr:hypothetical protein [Polyangiaceae bacterium]
MLLQGIRALARDVGLNPNLAAHMATVDFKHPKVRAVAQEAGLDPDNAPPMSFYGFGRRVLAARALRESQRFACAAVARGALRRSAS